MTDAQVNALAQACRAGAMSEAEMLAIIERHHQHEKRFICRYTQSLVCGFRSDAYIGPFSPLEFGAPPDQPELAYNRTPAAGQSEETPKK